MFFALSQQAVDNLAKKSDMYLPPAFGGGKIQNEIGGYIVVLFLYAQNGEYALFLNVRQRCEHALFKELFHSAGEH